MAVLCKNGFVKFWCVKNLHFVSRVCFILAATSSSSTFKSSEYFKRKKIIQINLQRRKNLFYFKKRSNITEHKICIPWHVCNELLKVVLSFVFSVEFLCHLSRQMHLFLHGNFESRFMNLLQDSIYKYKLDLNTAIWLADRPG